MVLPLAVLAVLAVIEDEDEEGAGCCSWGMTGPRRTTMWR
jgi:hypothetical protein